MANNNFDVNIIKEDDTFWLGVTHNGQQWDFLRLDNIEQMNHVITVLKQAIARLEKTTGIENDL